MELSPELQVKALTAERYMLLGALAITNPDAPDQSWRNAYKERLVEIEQELGE